MQNLVKVNLFGIHQLFLKVGDKRCKHLIDDESLIKVEKLNDLINKANIEHTKGEKTESGIMLNSPQVKLVSKNHRLKDNDEEFFSIDLSDQIMNLRTQYRLIKRGQKAGSFGNGHLNMWYKVGMTTGLNT